MKLENRFTLQCIKNKIENQNAIRSIADKAAVLIPIITIDDQISLLFQVRSSKLSWQPGDICFPGGRMERKDNTPIDTAIRETNEEIGTTKASISIYGQLPAFYSAIGLQIYPIIGEILSPEFELNKDEVEAIFTVPIAWFINNPPLKSTIDVAHKPASDFPFELIPSRANKWQKRSQHEIYFYHYQQYVIWGLTAQIVQLFLKAIR